VAALTINVHDSLRKRLWGFLRQIVPDAAIDLGVQRMLEQCKTNTNRKRLKKLESVGDKMPTFRKLPKSWQEFL
jgi:hypothetical protein